MTRYSLTMMTDTPLIDVETLQLENRKLLEELEYAYKNMEMILEQSIQEQKIAYNELQNKFNALEKLYRDVSRKENMLVHLEKLTSIGQFISEIIHELNTPLTGISGGAHLLKTMNPPDNLKPFINIIEQNVQRMTGYLSRFKNMIYKGEESFTLFNANENLRECLETIEILKPKNVRLSFQPYNDALPVKGDPQQINQIYLNLAKNAFDALQERGGSLLVRTRLVDKNWILESGEFAEFHCQERAVWKELVEHKAQFALIEIQDDGEGIPSDLLPKIFEAFFTTKPRGKGTGLGLSISGDIAKRHGGNLGVRSNLGVGTVFQLLLPIAKLTEV